MIDIGFKAIVVCINAALLPQAFIGRIIDTTFQNDLPPNIDPCGENGEFHTFCFDGSVFKNSVPFIVGEKVYREYKAPAATSDDDSFIKPQQSNMGFWFCGLIPV